MVRYWEESSSQVEIPLITRAIKENTESGSETVGRGGDLQGRDSTLLPLKHLRHPEASSRLKTDSGRLSVKRVPGGTLVQGVESLHVDQVSAGTGLDGKS